MYGLDNTFTAAQAIEDSTDGTIPDPTFGHGLMVNEVSEDLGDYNEPLHIFYNVEK